MTVPLGDTTLNWSLLVAVIAAVTMTLGNLAADARTLDDYSGLRRHRPWLAASLIVCLLGLVGTPPTGVFAGKLTIFTAAFDAGLGWLVVVAAINTVASVFYYPRWITPAMRTTGEVAEPDRVGAVTAYVAALVSVAVGLLAGPVLAAVS